MAVRALRHRGRLLILAALALLTTLALLPAAAPAAGAAGANTARLRAIHAVPDFGAVDIYVNHEKVLGDVTFFTVSPYLSVPAGNVRVQVIPAGDNIGHPRLFVVDVTLRLAAGKDYTAVARGSVAAHSVGASLFEDDNSRPTLGQARLRAVHLSPDAPKVDLFINGERQIEDLSFLEATGYLSVPAGTYQVGVAPAGGSPIFTASLTIEAGKVYTAWANGLLAGTGAQAFKITPSVDASFETARVRAVHAVPDIAGSPVDVYVNGGKVVTFDFFDATDYLELYAGEYDIRVVLAGGDPATEAVIQAKVTVEGGKDYSIIARGTGGTLGATVLEDDNSRPTLGQARLRAAHFSPDAPTVDLFINGERQIEDLSFREATGYLSVPAGTYQVGVAPAGGSPIFTASLTIEAGKVYTAWANGLLAGTGAQAFKVTPTVDASYELSLLRVLHAVPNAPAVDVYLGDEKVVSGLSFAEVTKYASVYAGTYDVKVTPAGASTVVLSGTVSLAGGKAYTAAAIGLLGAPSLQLKLLDDSAVPAAGKGLLRVVHLAPNAPAVDVLSGAAAPAALSTDALASGLGFGQSAAVTVEPGTQRFRVTLAGGGAALLSGQATVLKGTAATVYVVGLAGEAPAGQGLRLFTASDAPGGTPATTFTVHLPLVQR